MGIPSTASVGLAMLAVLMCFVPGGLADEPEVVIAELTGEGAALPLDLPLLSCYVRGDCDVILTGDRPDSKLNPYQVAKDLREEMARLFLASHEFRLLERQLQSVIDQEVEERMERGDSLEQVLIEVGRKYRVERYAVVTRLVAELDYDSGFPPLIRARTKGSVEVDASWLNVSTGETLKKPVAKFSGREECQPPAFCSKALPRLAMSLVEAMMGHPIHIAVEYVEREQQSVIINQGTDLGLRVKQRVMIREPSRPGSTLPGPELGEAEVTDRVSATEAACRVLLSGKKLDDFFIRVKELLAARTPPEVTLK